MMAPELAGKKVDYRPASQLASHLHTMMSSEGDPTRKASSRTTAVGHRFPSERDTTRIDPRRRRKKSSSVGFRSDSKERKEAPPRQRDKLEEMKKGSELGAKSKKRQRDQQKELRFRFLVNGSDIF